MAASFGGIELNKKISYDRQISNYSQIAANFVSDSGLKPDAYYGGYYLPKWLDDEAWKTTHSNKYTSTGNNNERERIKFLKEYPKWEDFKKYCYNKAETKKYNECIHSDGWCSECARRDGWEWDKARARR